MLTKLSIVHWEDLGEEQDEQPPSQPSRRLDDSAALLTANEEALI